jgi:hypothetical protein
VSRLVARLQLLGGLVRRFVASVERSKQRAIPQTGGNTKRYGGVSGVEN